MQEPQVRWPEIWRSVFTLIYQAGISSHMTRPYPNPQRRNEWGLQAVESLIIIFVFCIILIVIVTLVFPQTTTLIKNHVSTYVASQPTPVATEPSSVQDKSSGGTLTSLADKAIIVALVSGLIAGIAWSYKQFLVTLNRRAKVLIIEFLSDNRPHTRQEIKSALKVWKYGPMFLDALSELVEEGKVTVQDKQYSLPKKSGESKIILTD